MTTTKTKTTAVAVVCLAGAAVMEGCLGMGQPAQRGRPRVFSMTIAIDHVGMIDDWDVMIH
jgi:hypothetical protein